MGIRDDILSKESWIDKKEIKSYSEFLNKDDKEINAIIRRSTSTGRPPGREGFIKKLERILSETFFQRMAVGQRRRIINSMGSVPSFL